MVQQNRRGGRVKLHSILLPETEFNHKDKGDALYAMELALSLEKLNFTKLRELHRVACNAEDAQLADFIGARLFRMCCEHDVIGQAQSAFVSFFLLLIVVKCSGHLRAHVNLHFALCPMGRIGMSLLSCVASSIVSHKWPRESLSSSKAWLSWHVLMAWSRG